jgi:hypothetical protein
MPEFDAEEFVAALDRMGVTLTAVPLAGGTYRVNRWRLPQAVEKSEQIEKLWNSQIGDNQTRIDQLASHLTRTQPRPTTNRIMSELRKVK